MTFWELISKCHFLKFGVTLKKNYSIVFHGRVTELFEIYLSIAGRVGNIKNISLNNFKMVKSTKKHKS